MKAHRSSAPFEPLPKKELSSISWGVGRVMCCNLKVFNAFLSISISSRVRPSTCPSVRPMLLLSIQKVGLWAIVILKVPRIKSKVLQVMCVKFLLSFFHVCQNFFVYKVGCTQRCSQSHELVFGRTYCNNHRNKFTIDPFLRCVRQERISIRGSVCPSVDPSVGPSVTPVQKTRFWAVFGHGEILHWNKWSTNMFWELFHPSVRPSVSPYRCCMINTRWDTARTHRCLVGLVLNSF